VANGVSIESLAEVYMFANVLNTKLLMRYCFQQSVRHYPALENNPEFNKLPSNILSIIKEAYVKEQREREAIIEARIKKQELQELMERQLQEEKEKQEELLRKAEENRKIEAEKRAKEEIKAFYIKSKKEEAKKKDYEAKRAQRKKR
jgi:TRAP-type mannitol/chloroaromatic compound transport system substrate-binding protein